MCEKVFNRLKGGGERKMFTLSLGGGGAQKALDPRFFHFVVPPPPP